MQGNIYNMNPKIQLMQSIKRVISLKMIFFTILLYFHKVLCYVYLESSQPALCTRSCSRDVHKLVCAKAILSCNDAQSVYLAYREMSLVLRKPDFCICENKDADQLRGNREADQRLCFRYTDSTIPLLSKLLVIFCSCTARFMSDLVENPEDRFSQNEAQITACLDIY